MMSNSANSASSNNLKPQSSSAGATSQRKTSIVDMLSTPPALDSSDHESAEQLVPSATLSRNPSTASSAVSSSVGLSYSSESRDWQDVPLIELVQEGKLVFINGNISIEEAFKTLASHNLTSLPVEEFEHDINCITFDYGDLNTYLLLVLHKIGFVESDLDLDPHFQLAKTPAQYLNDIKLGKQVPVKFVCQLASKNPFIKLNERLDTLSLVVELLGSGVHRVAIVDNENKITGILSQRRLIRYLWDNARRFPSLEPLLQSTLDEVGIGCSNVVFVYGDQPLIDALLIMHDDQISSVAVVDRQQNLLGNISITDVKHVSKSSQSFLLHKSCLHFVSVILNSRGLEDGQDSFPIFHVFPNSSLGRTIAKLVATKSHRLWIVKPRNTNSFSSPTKPPPPPPTSSSDSTNSDVPLSSSSSASMTTTTTGNSTGSTPSITPALPSNSPFANLKPEISGRAGKLIGVVSLTDILGLFASKSSNKTIDPHAARKQRRRSSSSASSRSMKSLEQLRRSSKPSDLRS